MMADTASASNFYSRADALGRETSLAPAGAPLIQFPLNHPEGEFVSSPNGLSGRGAVWLARLNGVQEVGGSNPLGPILR